MKKIVFFALIVISSISFSDVYDDSKVDKISGGENHSMVLTGNNYLWICGKNGDNQGGIWYGVLGTNDNNYLTYEAILVRVHDGDMNTTSGYIEGVIEFDAGWKHSLAVDNDEVVWSWGNNSYGQLGDGSQVERLSPVKVHSGAQNTGDYLVSIDTVAAGRSGSHSLAVDGDGYVFA